MEHLSTAVSCSCQFGFAFSRNGRASRSRERAMKFKSNNAKVKLYALDKCVDSVSQQAVEINFHTELSISRAVCNIQLTAK
jgi:hypothetical protein